MATLPRPDVKVRDTVVPASEGCPSGVEVEVLISRDNKAKSYTSAGPSHAEATGKVIRQILDDPHTAEYIP
jgi:hypothetical protein